MYVCMFSTLYHYMYIFFFFFSRLVRDFIIPATWEVEAEEYEI